MNYCLGMWLHTRVQTVRLSTMVKVDTGREYCKTVTMDQQELMKGNSNHDQWSGEPAHRPAVIAIKDRK